MTRQKILHLCFSALMTFGFFISLNTSAYIPTGNPTASGMYPKAGITCAANYINGIYVPFGTKIIFPDGSIRFVEDRMHPDYGHNAVDIFVDEYDEAMSWGRRQITCEVVLPY